MGYTHYWYHNRPFTSDEWKGIGEGFKLMMKALPDVPLAGGNGTGKPQITPDYLEFNGLAPQSVEAFEMFRTREAWERQRGVVGKRAWRGFCKTEHQPYDLAVMTTLLMISEIAPGALTVESDEDMEGAGWKEAREMVMRVH